MKSQFVGMLAAATIGLATSAHALNIQVGNIIPPGGNAEQAYLAAGSGSIFTPDVFDNAMLPGDVSTLSGIASAYSGSVVVLSMDTLSGTSLIVMSDSSFRINNASENFAAAAFQTGGMNVSDTGTGISAFGTPLAGAGLYAFAMVGLEAYSTGSINISKLSTLDVKFLSWNGSAWGVSNTGTYSAANGTLEFNFQVLPVPAPALLAGAGLLGATIVRRRMKKN